MLTENNIELLNNWNIEQLICFLFYDVFQYIHISVGEYVPAALYTEEKHRWEIINRHLEQGKIIIII